MKSYLKNLGIFFIALIAIAVFSFGSLATGLYAGVQLGKSANLCQEVPIYKEINYTGYVSNDGNGSAYLFVDSQGYDDGVIYHGLPNTQVNNSVAKDRVTFSQKIYFGCTAGEPSVLDVETSIQEEGETIVPNSTNKTTEGENRQ